MKRLIVIAASLAFSASAAAQMYKWKDKDGHTRYGDVPPPGANATPMRGTSRNAPYAAPTPDDAKADAKADAKPDAKPDAKTEAKNEKALTPEQAFRKRQQERAAADEKAQQERQRAEAKRSNCDTAQTQLRVLQSGQRVSTVNAAGERVYIDDDQRAAEMTRAQKAVADWCN